MTPLKPTIINGVWVMRPAPVQDREWLAKQERDNEIRPPAR